MAATTDESPAKVPSEPRGESRAVRLMALGGAAIAIAAIAAGLSLDPTFRRTDSLDLISWTVATAVSAFAIISLGKPRPALSMDLPVLLACSFVLGPVVAAGIAFVSTTTSDELRGRVTLSKVVWNHAQISLSVLAAGYAFMILGGELGSWPVSLAAAAGAFLVDSAINYPSVALLTSVSDGKPIGEVLRRMTIGTPAMFALTYGAFALTSLLIAEAYVALGPISLVAAIAPIVLARQVFLNSRKIEGISRQLKSRAAALMRVDERIADERRDERARIAEALHDDVLQALYTVTLHAHVIREDYRSGRLLDLENDVPSVVDAAEKAAALVRDYIYGLRKSSVGHAGLIDTVGLMIAHLHDESGIAFVSDLDSEIKADPAVELLIYQVVREALTNIVRHSGAESAWVSLKTEGGAIHLSVLDNGEGFDLDEDRDPKHFGLDLMSERAEATGGSIEIRSNARGGTSVEAWFKPHLNPS